jgi:hypothetical protein
MTEKYLPFDKGFFFFVCFQEKKRAFIYLSKKGSKGKNKMSCLTQILLDLNSGEQPFQPVFRNLFLLLSC